MPKLIKICNLFDMIKQEAFQLKMKKIECNIHGDPIKYKCDYSACQSPYICAQTQCMDEHFHQDQKLTITKFNPTLWYSKFQEVQNVMNSNLLKVKVENLYKIVHYFNESLTKIKKKMNNFEEMRVKLVERESQGFNQQHLESVDDFLASSSLLDRKVDKLRSKMGQDQIIFTQSQSEGDLIMEETPQIDRSSNGLPPLESPQIQQIDRFQAQQEQYQTEVQQNRQEEGENEYPNQDVSNNGAQNLTNAQVTETIHKQTFPQPINNENGEHHKLPEPINLNEEDSQFDALFQKSPIKQEDYRQNKKLQHFLQNHIYNFNWNRSKVLFSLQQSAISCQKFHQRLRDKTDILFLFFGQDFIIGSYYHQPYPSIAERLKKDIHSFIFIQDSHLDQHFALFKADPHADSHISVSEKLLICQGNTPNNGDGLRTFQRTFDSLLYFLPSKSYYDSIEGREVTYNGLLKIRQCYVLELDLGDE